MMKAYTTLALALLSLNSYSYQIGDPVKAASIITNKTSNRALEGGNGPKLKSLMLMNIKFTPKEMKHLLLGAHKKNRGFSSTDNTSGLPESIDLGMNEVPVFDQGVHATSSTFAVTAAFDAVINRGDYISQLCSLELGSYLRDQSYFSSGWAGTSPFNVISQLERFGIVKKSDQLKKSCAGVSEYPVSDISNRGNEMTLTDYHQMSHGLSDIVPETYFDTRSIFTMAERLRIESEEEFNSSSNALLSEVKSELARTEAQYTLRMVVTAMLPYEFCHDGACAKHNQDNDTFVLTDEMMQQAETGLDVAEQTMVITGYDDNAIAIDNAGMTHKGLLTLRNSWGADTGDNGNFYMSYDFFRFGTVEVGEVMGSFE